MNGPKWLTLEEVRAVHARQLRRFGGPTGMRDPSALASALNRPIDRWHCSESDLAALAAAYAFGLAQNHPFIDGNKRTAFLAMMMFLRLNGIASAPDQATAATMFLGLAAGETREDELAQWIRNNWPRP